MVQDIRLQTRAIRENAHTVTGSRQDYNSLIDWLGDSRFVLIGEASRGTHDFYHTLYRDGHRRFPLGRPGGTQTSAPGDRR